MNAARALACCVAALLVPAVAAPPETIELRVPANCVLGQTCFIQQYFDHDRGPGAKDYRCGPMSYDGHDGLDIRLPTMEAQRKGVEVVAAAPGVVKGMRDGMPDADIRTTLKLAVSGRECGNGVVLDHANGWQTQYCHMAKGSVRVHIGQSLEAGAVLGLIGESGQAAFPHVHFTVRHGGAKIDPFAAGDACGAGPSLWSAAAQKALAYTSPQLINAGFSAAAVSMQDIESGAAGHTKPDSRSGVIVAFVRAIGLARNDVQTLTLTAPNGAVLAEQRSAPLDHDKAEWMLFIGKKKSGGDWASGRYSARYRVEREGRLVLDRRFAQEVQR